MWEWCGGSSGILTFQSPLLFLPPLDGESIPQAPSPPSPENRATILYNITTKGDIEVKGKRGKGVIFEKFVLTSLPSPRSSPPSPKVHELTHEIMVSRVKVLTNLYKFTEKDVHYSYLPISYALER